jgi:hypothetical protein
MKGASVENEIGVVGGHNQASSSERLYPLSL